MRTWISILTTAFAAAALGGFISAPALAEGAAMPVTTGAISTDKQTPCKTSLDRVKLSSPLARISHKIAAGDAVTIVAIGSSSTAGAGATSASASYPSQLEAALSAHFPKSQIKVINRGVNGEEAADMMKRFKDGVLAEKPDLVLWQLGTNSILRDRPMSDYEALVHNGIVQLRASGADVVLVDPQYAPKVITKADVEKMVDLIGVMAKRDNIGVFKRFATMRTWYSDEKIPFETFITPDGVHMNDWGYACFAKTLSVAIIDAATRPVTTVAASPSSVR